MPQTKVAVVGFRQDRIGARLVGLLNILRIGQSFGVPARFVWLSEPEGPYPDLADPCDFLAPDFVARHIEIVRQRPDLSGYRNLTAEAQVLNGHFFARALAEGARFHSDAAFEVLRLIDEDEARVRAEIAAIAAALPLSAGLSRHLAAARARLADLAGPAGVTAAIHVRRGDILEVAPWCLGPWPSKYVPDEFFRDWAAGQQGPVLAFSDTPAAVRHLARGEGRILLADDLVSSDGLTIAERDILELLLLAGFARIGAPAGSAFSRAAQIVGGGRVDSLPGDLPTPRRLAAHDALLDRALAGPESFFAPGDLAQSLHYAGGHALTRGRGAELAAALAGQEALMAAHPFLRLVLAQSALAAGDAAAGRRALDAALADPRLQRRDRVQARQLRLLTQAEEPGFDLDGAVLGEVFLGPQLATPAVAILAHRALGRAGRAGEALMIAPDLVRALSRASGAGDDPGIPALGAGAGQHLLPAWTYLADWDELLPGDAARQVLRRAPPLALKLHLAGTAGARADAALEAGERPAEPEDALTRQRIGLYGAALSLHGRYRRALRLHGWLKESAPDDPLTIKRLGDSCFRAGNAATGMRHLDEALAILPAHLLLRLSRARRRAEAGDRAGAEADLAKAADLWPGLALIAQQRRQVARRFAPPSAGSPAAP